MKRRLTKAEIEIQLAEKRRRIDQHMQVIKDQSEFVAHSLKGRAEDASEKVREATDNALETVREYGPMVAAGGVGLLLAGGLVARLLKRKTSPRLHVEDIAALSEAVAHRLAQAGTLAHPVALPPIGVPPHVVHHEVHRRDDLLRVLLAGLAGFALKVALDHVPWATVLETVRERLQGPREMARPATMGTVTPIRPEGDLPRARVAAPYEIGVAPPPPREPI